MRFQGAVIREHGVTFLVVAVGSHVASDDLRAMSAIESYGKIFSDMPIVLMGQARAGMLAYFGRKDVVELLMRLDPQELPWRVFSFN